MALCEYLALNGSSLWPIAYFRAEMPVFWILEAHVGQKLASQVGVGKVKNKKSGFGSKVGF